MRVVIDGMELVFETDPALFSPSAPDRGTLAMLSYADIRPGMRVIDLGCGWGLVGVYAAKQAGEAQVIMLDIDPRAVRAAAHNAALNGVPGVRALVSDAYGALEESGFDLILTNPPYHSDFSVAKRFIEKGFNRLCLGGRMLMVTKRRDWYLNKFIAVFGGVRVHKTDGYFIFEAERRAQHYARAGKGVGGKR